MVSAGTAGSIDPTASHESVTVEDAREVPRLDPSGDTRPMSHRSAEAQRSAHLVDGALPPGDGLAVVRPSHAEVS
jgi:hypothetical protein